MLIADELVWYLNLVRVLEHVERGEDPVEPKLFYRLILRHGRETYLHLKFQEFVSKKCPQHRQMPDFLFYHFGRLGHFTFILRLFIHLHADLVLNHVLSRVPRTIYGFQVIDQKLQKLDHHLLILDHEIHISLAFHAKGYAVPRVERYLQLLILLPVNIIEKLTHYPESACEWPIYKALDIADLATNDRFVYFVLFQNILLVL